MGTLRATNKPKLTGVKEILGGKGRRKGGNAIGNYKIGRKTRSRKIKSILG